MYVIDAKLADLSSTSNLQIVVKSSRGRSVIPFRPGGPINGTPLLEKGWQEVEFPAAGERAEVWIESYDPAEAQAAINRSPVAPYQDYSQFGGELSRSIVGVKVSPSLTLGAVGQLTFARKWTKSELDQRAEALLVKAPPPPPPEGYEVITADTPLIPGMPILITSRGQWQASEMVGKYASNIVAVSDVEKASRGFQLHQYSRCAVARATLDKGKADPASFRPSIRLYPNSTSIIPENVELLSDTSLLVPGTPLHHPNRSNVTFVEMTPDGKILARNDNSPASKIEAAPREFGISRDVLARLSKPRAADEYGPRLSALIELLDREAAARDAMIAAGVTRQRLTISDQTPPENRIDVVPKGFVPMQDGYVVPRGTPVIGRDTNRWRSGLSLFDSAKGRVEIRWDGRIGGGMDERIARENLFIAKDVDDALRMGNPLQPAVACRVILKSGNQSPSSALSNLLRTELKLDPVIANRHAHTTEPVALLEKSARKDALILQARIAAAGGTATVEQLGDPAK